MSSRLLYAEARASLASARRSKRIAEHACGVAHRELERRWQDLTVVEIDDELTRAAGHVSDVFGLCTGDAIHLASALELGDPGLVVATWDGELRRAALDAGLAVCP